MLNKALLLARRTSSSLVRWARGVGGRTARSAMVTHGVAPRCGHVGHAMAAQGGAKAGRRGAGGTGQGGGRRKGERTRGATSRREGGTTKSHRLACAGLQSRQGNMKRQRRKAGLPAGAWGAARAARRQRHTATGRRRSKRAAAGGRWERGMKKGGGD